MAKAICILTGFFRAFGVVRFELNEGGLLNIKGEFSGLPPGRHELHVHSFGDITNDWISAGPPYNPTNKMQQGKRCADDLAVINVNEDGLAKLDVELHQNEDDPDKADKEESITAGSNGSGIAWGVIGICQSNISKEVLEENN
ncbi:superoxide dismutase [Cu-Zn]-like isoform X2 [Hemitrygon akajei]|uniref:superoxide dismutase [Cu-Zn]-like isoform X2 n=1 Tax=Hemitrygon akajei TaxID=2704970 RepID=UPI003BF96ABA